MTDVPALLQTWFAHMPLHSQDAFPTHVAGHPPAALLFFVGLVRVGLGGDLAAGVVVTLLAATTALAVMVAAARPRRGGRRPARGAVPGAGPDRGVHRRLRRRGCSPPSAPGAWPASRSARPRAGAARAVGWSVLAGLLLGTVVMMSYGLPLLGVVAVAVLLAARSWRPLPVAAAAALVVVLGFAAAGWAWWEAYPRPGRPLRGGHRQGPARGLLALGQPGAARHQRRPAGGLRRRPPAAPPPGRAGASTGPLLLVAGAGVLMVTAADASGMSKAEVERIWLPFMPWLLVSCALLPERWRRWGLALQLLTALVVQQLFYTRAGRRWAIS